MEADFKGDPETAETAFTLFEPVAFDGRYSTVRAIPETGRLHQIRATLCSLGFPLLGDKLYGPDDTLYLKIADDLITPEEWNRLVLKRQALHAYYPESRIKRTLFVGSPFPVPNLLSRSRILLLVSTFLIFPVLLSPIMPFLKRVFQIICLALACLLHFNMHVLLTYAHVKSRGLQARF